MPTPPKSGLSSRNSIDANAFPRQAGHSVAVNKRDNGLISPARSTFSFADEVEPVLMHGSKKPDLLDESQISRGSPGDAALMAMVNRDRTSTDLSRRKSQFYSEVFAYREPNLTVRERVNRYSVITAEVKTNIIVSKTTFSVSVSLLLADSFGRSKMNILSSKTFPSIFHRDTKGLSPPFSSPSTTQNACSLPAHSIPPIS